MQGKGFANVITSKNIEFKGEKISHRESMLGV